MVTSACQNGRSRGPTFDSRLDEPFRRQKALDAKQSSAGRPGPRRPRYSIYSTRSCANSTNFRRHPRKERRHLFSFTHSCARSDEFLSETSLCGRKRCKCKARREEPEKRGLSPRRPAQGVWSRIAPISADEAPSKFLDSGNSGAGIPRTRRSSEEVRTGSSSRRHALSPLCRSMCVLEPTFLGANISSFFLDRIYVSFAASVMHARPLRGIIRKCLLGRRDLRKRTSPLETVV